MGAILPYLLLASLLLTSILFAQQVSRLAELLVVASIPISLVGELAVALLPSVLTFTLPMAMLAGTIIGFSRMGSDSELIAMSAAGVSTRAIVLPVLIIGMALTSITLYNNLVAAPGAARTLRRGTLRVALHKLDSPVEPRSFNTDIPGQVIYVRDGDKAQGAWGRVFIYAQQRNGSIRLITARSGRIDSSAEQSELVLNDAVATTLPAGQSSDEKAYVTEHLAQLRVVLETGRKEILGRLRRDKAEPEELSWRELKAIAASMPGIESRAAATLLHKKISLALSPAVFSLLGAGIGLRIRKGGRGLGFLLAMVTMTTYYLILLIGEQMARAGTVHPVIGAWLATVMSIICGLVLLAGKYRNLLPEVGHIRSRLLRGLHIAAPSTTPRSAFEVHQSRFLSFPSLLDINLFRALLLSFIIAFTALVLVILVFTLFELWRFIIANGSSTRLVVQYFLFLLPLLFVQVLPATILITILTTYSTLAKRSEIIAWWACGQSVYRLMLPGVLFAVLLSVGAWFIQERLMPPANVRQDALRAQIRGGVSRAMTNVGQRWLASAETGRLYSYEYDEQGDTLMKPAIYDFDIQGVHLRRALIGDSARWINPDKLEMQGVRSIALGRVKVEQGKQEKMEITHVESPEIFKPTNSKASQLSAYQLSAYIKTVRKRGGEVNDLLVALQRKYAGPFGSIVMMLIAAPLALAYGRRSTLVALCLAIITAAMHWAIIAWFQQLGAYGLLPPTIASWAPPIIFSAIGIYLLSRTRT